MPQIKWKPTPFRPCSQTDLSLTTKDLNRSADGLDENKKKSQLYMGTIHSALKQSHPASDKFGFISFRGTSEGCIVNENEKQRGRKKGCSGKPTGRSCKRDFSVCLQETPLRPQPKAKKKNLIKHGSFMWGWEREESFNAI